jgi:hypothetical protein
VLRRARKSGWPSGRSADRSAGRRRIEAPLARRAARHGGRDQKRAQTPGLGYNEAAECAPKTRHDREGVNRMTKLDRPREIIEFCLQPLGLTTTTEEYKEAYRRLEHVIKTFQLMAIREKMPTEVDFSNMRTITINEAAHGDET